jgi:endonuclease G
MNTSAYIKREARYGIPAADQILYNRHFTVGYSYYFRQAKWALEVIDQNKTVERLDNFRSDYRIPAAFRQDAEDYKGTGFHRGHLVASANQRDLQIQNSETFLLSNMSPQVAGFNTGIWKELEEEVRRLDKFSSVLETYVICGPLFDFSKPTKEIGANTANKVTIPVPTHYFKSVLAERKSGRLDIWSFYFPNEATNSPLSDFQRKTSFIERLSGVILWGALTGDKVEKKKHAIKKLW